MSTTKREPTRLAHLESDVATLHRTQEVLPNGAQRDQSAWAHRIRANYGAGRHVTDTVTTYNDDGDVIGIGVVDIETAPYSFRSAPMTPMVGPIEDRRRHMTAWDEFLDMIEIPWAHAGSVRDATRYLIATMGKEMAATIVRPPSWAPRADTDTRRVKVPRPGSGGAENGMRVGADDMIDGRDDGIDERLAADEAVMSSDFTIGDWARLTAAPDMHNARRTERYADQFTEGVATIVINPDRSVAVVRGATGKPMRTTRQTDENDVRLRAVTNRRLPDTATALTSVATVANKRSDPTTPEAAAHAAAARDRRTLDTIRKAQAGGVMTARVANTEKYATTHAAHAIAMLASFTGIRLVD